jgi:hypothetical protein
MTPEQIEARKSNAQSLVILLPDGFERDDALKDIALCDLALKGLQVEAMRDKELEALQIKLLDVTRLSGQRAMQIDAMREAIRRAKEDFEKISVRARTTSANPSLYKLENLLDVIAEFAIKRGADLEQVLNEKGKE